MIKNMIIIFDCDFHLLFYKLLAIRTTVR